MTHARARRARAARAAAGILLFERNLMSYRRMWPIIVSGFFEPLFYLLSLGYRARRLRRRRRHRRRRRSSTRRSSRPALLAASAMNGAFYDATNIFWKLRYQKLYDAMLATPLGPKDIAAGETAWALFRGLLYAIGFFTVIVALGLSSRGGRCSRSRRRVFIGFALRRRRDRRRHLHAQLAGLRHPQPRDPADVPLLGDVLPALDVPGLARVGDPGDAALQRRRPLRALTTGTVGAGSARERRLPAVLGLVGTWIASRRVEKLLLT